MTFLDATLLGIVEGITEFLPISSTGHLILTSHLLNLEQTEFLKSFEIAIQLGAILAVVILYFRTFVESMEIAMNVVAAFIPTAIIGLLLHDIVKAYFLNSQMIVLWSLLLGGIALIGFELWHKEEPHAVKHMKHMTLKQALWIGVFQSFAIIPGVSRAAATIVGGLLVGLDRRTIVDFSFLLAVPTMLAATGLDLFKTSATFTSQEWTSLGIGFIVAFLVALMAIKWLLQYIRHHTFIPFGIYRIGVALIFWFFIL